jgi:hypothetical protein
MVNNRREAKNNIGRANRFMVNLLERYSPLVHV